MIIEPNDPNIRGGISLQQVPLIPYEMFVACGIKTHFANEIRMAFFDPQPMETLDEVFQTLRFLISSQVPKPGPIKWETVPEEVQRHFRFESENSTGN